MKYTATRNQALNGLKQAEAKVQSAIQQQKKGQAISKDVQQVLKIFFPKQDESFLPILLKRIQLVKKNVIPHVRLKTISKPDKNDPDKALHKYAIKKKVPAAALPQRRYVAIYNPHWANHKPYQPGILIHEAFHYYFSFVRGHSKTNRRTNAFAYQGFVSTLGGLPIGETLKGNLGLITNKQIVEVCNTYVAPILPFGNEICKQVKRALD